MVEKIKNFRELKMWKLGKELVLDVYETTKQFPKDETYGLVSQMRRSAVSIPSNIAEGFNRFHNKEFKHFLYVSLGSCSELETQIEIAFDLKYLEKADKIRILEKIDYVSRMHTNLIKKLG